MEEQVIAFIVAQSQAHPSIAIILLVMSVFRCVFKPFMSFVEAVAKSTPTTVDDGWVEKFEGSSVYKGIVWTLDYFTSIKLPLYEKAPDATVTKPIP